MGKVLSSAEIVAAIETGVRSANETSKRERNEQ